MDSPKWRIHTLRLLFFLIVFSPFSDAYAQKKWFIKPHFHSSFGFSFVDPSDYFSTEKQVFGNQYIYTPFTVSYNSRFIKRPPVNVGIDIGFISDNNKHMFQLEWKRDQVSYEAMCYFRNPVSPTYDGFYALLRRRFHRIALSYSFNLVQKDNFLKTWFSVGTGLSLNFNSYDEINAKWNFDDYYVAPNVQLKSIFIQPFAERRINGFLKIGFENDFYIKKKYIASLGIHYVQGLGVISRVEYIHEYFQNNETTYNVVGLVSRGSNFSVELSRRFQLYPWKPNKKEKNVE